MLAHSKERRISINGMICGPAVPMKGKFSRTQEGSTDPAIKSNTNIKLYETFYSNNE